MTADKVLDSIYKQMRECQKKRHNPKLRIWINPHDVMALIVETNLLPRDSKVHPGTKTKLLDQEVIVSLDVAEFNPTVEIIHDK